ncbi:peptide chain release factor N(5)-glutamine methyltransferase [soil metagenome]
MMDSVQDRIAQARRTLVAAGISTQAAGFDAEVLARHALGWDRATLLTRGREPGPDHFEARFAALLTRRAAREPVALIVGRREFWGLDFEVTSDVLIPRPETEFIVEEALDVVRQGHVVRTVIDVGTGSGCVAVALATELPHAAVTATDVSSAALVVARRNAVRHGVAGRMRFITADLLAGLALRVDLIVANPPYVPSTAAAGLLPEVARYEPTEALYGGADGLGLIRRLLAEASARLLSGGRLIFEFGDGQEADVLTAAESAGWTILNVRNDLQDIARIVTLRRDA